LFYAAEVVLRHGEQPKVTASGRNKNTGTPESTEEMCEL
jgi:hypothetical protein